MAVPAWNRDRYCGKAINEDFFICHLAMYLGNHADFVRICTFPDLHRM